MTQYTSIAERKSTAKGIIFLWRKNMKNRKKLLSFLLAMVMVFALAAGGTQMALADTQTAEQADAAINTSLALCRD